jgi:Flp pilus assembly protein TadG
MLANQTWWNMSSSARAGALAAAAQSNMQEQRDSTRAAGIAAISQLWQYYNNPALLDDQCQHQQTKAFVCLTVLGVGCRLLVWLLVKYKVMRKAHE